jgi:hypothetical protein
MGLAMVRDALELSRYPMRAQETRLLAVTGALRGMESWYAAYENKVDDMHAVYKLLKTVDKLMDRHHGRRRCRGVHRPSL